MPAATGAAATGVNLFSLALRAIPIIAIISTIALLIANWDDVSAAAKKLWEAVSKWWGEIYEDIKDFADKAIKWLKENWPLILGVLTGPFGLFVVWISKHKDEIIEKFKDLWEGVKTAVSEKVTSIIDTVKNLWNGLKDFIVDYFSDKADSFLGAIKTGWNAVKDFVGEIVELIKLTVGIKFLEMFTKVTEVVSAIRTGVVEKFSELKDKAIEKFNELKSAASRIWDSISGYIRSVATNIKNRLDTVYQDMVEVGKDIANGIIDGLFRISGVFRTKLAQWVKDNIPDWIKKVLQISSPSKVMVGIGTNIAQGLTQGLTGSNTVPISSRPILTPAPSTSKAPVNITINAGAGTDAYALGRTVTNAVNKFSRVSSKTGRYTAL